MRGDARENDVITIPCTCTCNETFGAAELEWYMHEGARAIKEI